MNGLNNSSLFPYSLNNLQVISTSDGGSLPVSCDVPLIKTLTSSNQVISLYESSPDLIDFENYNKSLKTTQLFSFTGNFQNIYSTGARLFQASITGCNVDTLVSTTSIYSFGSLNAPNAFPDFNGINSVGSNHIQTNKGFTGPYITASSGSFQFISSKTGVLTNILCSSGVFTSISANTFTINSVNIPNIEFTNMTGVNSYITNMSGAKLDINRINSTLSGRIKSDTLQADTTVLTPYINLQNAAIWSPSNNDIELASNNAPIYFRKGVADASNQMVYEDGYLFVPTGVFTNVSSGWIDTSYLNWGLVATGPKLFVNNLVSTIQTGTNAFLTNIVNTTMTGSTIWSTNLKQNSTLWNRTSTASDRLNWQWNGTDYMILENQNAGLLTTQNAFLKNNLTICDQGGYAWADKSYALNSLAGPVRIGNDGASRYALIDLGATGPYSERAGYIYYDSPGKYISIVNQENGELYFGVNNGSGQIYIYRTGSLIQSACNDSGNFCSIFKNQGSSNAYGTLIDYNDTNFALGIRDRSSVYRYRFGNESAATFTLAASGSNANGYFSGQSFGGCWMSNNKNAIGYYGYAEPTTQPTINLWIDKQTAITYSTQPYLKLGSYEYSTKNYHLIGAGYANKQFDTQSPLLFGGWMPTSAGRTREDFVVLTRPTTADDCPDEHFRVCSNGNGGTLISSLFGSTGHGYTGSNLLDNIANIGYDYLKIVGKNTDPLGFESTTNYHHLSLTNGLTNPSSVLNLGCNANYSYIQSLGYNNYNLYIQSVSQTNAETQIHNKGASITGTNAGLIFRQTTLYPRETSTVIVYSQKGQGTSDQGVWIEGIENGTMAFITNTSNQIVYFTGSNRRQFNQPDFSNTNYNRLDVPVKGLYQAQMTLCGTCNLNFGSTQAEIILTCLKTGTVITKSQGTFLSGKFSLSTDVIKLMDLGDRFTWEIQLGACGVSDVSLTFFCQLIQ